MFDVKSIGVSAKEISFGLTFNVTGLDLGMLGHFAKRNGRLQVHNIGEIPEGSSDEDEAE